MSPSANTCAPVALRVVRRPQAESPSVEGRGHIGLVRAPSAVCPRCEATVAFDSAAPLSTFPCPACGGPVFAAARLGCFLLRGRVGEGQMGDVYLATDESLGRDVAIKLVRSGDANSPASRERLRSEACAAGRLNHPRVAQVYALNFSNGHPYLVMELVRGEDFAHKLARERRLSERDVLRMALDVAAGLSALAREGLAHGDIKPGNIVLDRDGRAKLVDFGLSGISRHKSDSSLVGTPNYIAPELLQGAADTHRSDLYSFGATLYHLLSGRPSFEGDKTIDVLRARLTQRPAPLGSVARHVTKPTQALVMSLLDPDPRQRPQDSDAVADSLREALRRLDEPAPEPARAAGLRRLFEGPRAAPQPALSRRHASIVVLYGPVIVGLELMIAIPARSFPEAWSCLASRAPHRSARAEAPPEPAVQDLIPQVPRPQTSDSFMFSDGRFWQSLTLGGFAQRGSTMRIGGTLVIQGPGSGGPAAGGRFVWAAASSDYALEACVYANRDDGGAGDAGLLVAGSDPASSTSLFFGYLATGELVLQVRAPGRIPWLIQRSAAPYSPRARLKLARRGGLFEAFVSADGGAWQRFASSELELPDANAAGFLVCANVAGELATGAFTRIRLR